MRKGVLSTANPLLQCCWCFSYLVLPLLPPLLPHPPKNRWVPVSERSRSLSLVYSGMFIGSIMGLSLSPAMIASMGWPSVFYIFGSLGVLWYTAWSSKAASTPQDDPSISREEKVREEGGGRGAGGLLLKKRGRSVCGWGLG